MERIDERLSAQVVSRRPVASSGASGNRVEHVTLADGRTLVCKHVVPADDWISRSTHDDGRAVRMWEQGLFDRIPRSIDHTTVAVEPTDDGWAVFMRDASPSLIAPDRRLDRAEVRRILAAVVDLHRAFAGERFDGLCSLADRYNLLSPATARRESDNLVGAGIGRCWEVFADMADPDVGAAILALAEDPAPLTARLDQCQPTLIHGDVRLTNLGLTADRLVLFDWGERTGTAPGAVDLASFLVFDGRMLGESRDDVIADYRDLAGADFDPLALDLALIGGLVQLGPNVVFDVVLRGGEEHVAAAKEDLAWWCATARRVFDTTWAPD